MHTYVLTLANGEALVVRASSADGALVKRNIDLFSAIKGRPERARREALEQSTAVRADHSDTCTCMSAAAMIVAGLYE